MRSLEEVQLDWDVRVVSCVIVCRAPSRAIAYAENPEMAIAKGLAGCGLEVRQEGSALPLGFALGVAAVSAERFWVWLVVRQGCSSWILKPTTSAATAGIIWSVLLISASRKNLAGVAV